MVMTWLVGFDGLLGLWFLGLTTYVLLRGQRTPVTWFLAAVCFIVSFRILYFAIPILFGGTPSNALRGVFMGSEDVFGIALVGTMMFYGRQTLGPRERSV